MFLQTYTKLTLLLVFLGSMLFLMRAIKARENERRLRTLTGVSGLLYVGMGLLWYLRFVQSSAMALAYYFSWHIVGGVALSMFAYVSRLASAKVLLLDSTAWLVGFNVFAITRHHVSMIGSLWWADGLYGGALLASLALLWLNPTQRREQSAS